MTASALPNSDAVRKAIQEVRTFQGDHLKDTAQQSLELVCNLAASSESNATKLKEKEAEVTNLRRELKAQLDDAARKDNERTTECQDLHQIVKDQKVTITALEATIGLQQSELEKLKQDTSLEQLEERNRQLELRVSRLQTTCATLERLNRVMSEQFTRDQQALSDLEVEVGGGAKRRRTEAS